MRECKDCKWWHPLKSEWDLPGYGHSGYAAGRGICELASGRSEWPAHSDSRLPEHAESLAKAIDHEDYQAWLLTAPDFGCNQFVEDDELVEYEEIIHLNFESRLQRAYTARGRAFEHRWREFDGALPDYDYGWRRTPEHDKASIG